MDPMTQFNNTLAAISGFSSGLREPARDLRNAYITVQAKRQMLRHLMQQADGVLIEATDAAALAVQLMGTLHHGERQRSLWDKIVHSLGQVQHTLYLAQQYTSLEVSTVSYILGASYQLLALYASLGTDIRHLRFTMAGVL
ncbi:hypothetical protein EIP91_007083 [Steccherinum ochraceum]|uniref:Uncharacterized protein n=1 Tax=Steccherinum ochraceum TaxID=92696 RepID=A0A4R0R781_9APHY|nr:hypothetical protein EIP91_007083 [Steccherinum ochraceum]